MVGVPVISIRRMKLVLIEWLNSHSGNGWQRLADIEANGHSKRVSYHVASVAMFFMYYNYCRVHATIGTTPAAASGLADHVWSLDELIRLAD